MKKWLANSPHCNNMVLILNNSIFHSDFKRISPALGGLTMSRSLLRIVMVRTFEEIESTQGK